MSTRAKVAASIASAAERAALDYNRAMDATISVVQRSFDDVAWGAAAQGGSSIQNQDNITDVVVVDDKRTSVTQINTGQRRPVVVDTTTKAIQIKLWDNVLKRSVALPLHAYLQNPTRFSMPGTDPVMVDNLLQNPSDRDREEQVQLSFKVLYLAKARDESKIEFAQSFFNYGTNNADNPQNFYLYGQKTADYLSMDGAKPGWASFFPRVTTPSNPLKAIRHYMKAEDTGVKAQRTTDITSSSFSEADRARLAQIGFSNGDDIFLTVQIPNKKKDMMADRSTACPHFRPAENKRRYRCASMAKGCVPLSLECCEMDDCAEFDCVMACQPPPPCHRGALRGAETRTTNIAKLGIGSKVLPKGIEERRPELYEKPLRAVYGRGPGSIRIHVTRVVVVDGAPSQADIRTQFDWLRDQSALARTFTDADWQATWQKYTQDFAAAYPRVNGSQPGYAAQELVRDYSHLVPGGYIQQPPVQQDPFVFSMGSKPTPSEPHIFSMGGQPTNPSPWSNFFGA